MDKLHDNTLDLAESLLKGESFGEAAVRRAVSSAYYALFQRLSSLCASRLSGKEIGSEEYRQLYRALDHKRVRDALKNKSSYKAELGLRFEQLQEARHWADYSIAAFQQQVAASAAPGVSTNGPRAYIDMARDALQFIDALGSDAQLKLAILLIVRDR